MIRRRFLKALAVALAGASLTRCTLYYGRQVSTEEKQQLMAEDSGLLQHTWTDVKGLRIHSLVSAQPSTADLPAVALVHGSGLSGRYMIPTAVQLVKNFRVFVPDLPGFGLSENPQAVLNVPELADWVAAWIPAIGLQRVALLGNSFGCQVIADLAARYPERVEEAILQGPTTPPDERSIFWQFIRWRQNQRYNPDSLGEVTNDDYRRAGLRRMLWSFCYQLTDRIEDKAPLIQAPVLVVRGEHDPIANQQWCERIAELCPRGRLVIIPEVAHTLCYTAPVELAAVTRAFIKEG